MSTRSFIQQWRGRLVDEVYGAEDTRGLKIYLAVLWGGLLLLALILTGTTPWAAPAEREGKVESLQTVTCDAILDEASGDRTDTGDDKARSTNRSATKAGTRARSQCRQLLSDAERAQLGRTEATIAYLQRGGVTPPPLAVPEDTPLRDWIDSRICGLRGVDAEDRGALAWHVQQGIGECGAWSRTVARLPITVWWGPIAGIVLTPLILLGLLFLLGRHSVRIPSTRRAYRRLFGSEHKAP